ncbi:MAG: hypothetical protein Q8M53_04685 [Burkholderiales bacterium]|nr:hypothetical protein [Burkholderiales bacterium]
MSMIACPECAKEISDKAAVCPHCKKPAAKMQNAAANASPSIKTMTPAEDVTSPAGKEWKIVQLIGGLLMVIGVVAWIGNSSDAGMVIFLGCLIYLGGRLGAWRSQD